MEQTKSYFDKLSSEWDKKYSESCAFQARFRFFKELVEKYKTKGGRALDYGCGSGVITELLKSHYRSVVATDCSDGMMAVVQRKFSEDRTVMVRDIAASLQLKYDMIVCSSVIEYVEDDHKLLCTLAGLLEDHGVLIMTFPNRFGILQNLNRVLLKRLDKGNYTHFQEHVYRKSCIEEMIGRCDLDVKEMLFTQGLPFVPAFLRELICCVAQKGSRESLRNGV